MEQELTQPIRLDPPFEPEALRSLFPSDVVVEIARPALVVRGLYPEEQIYIARAVDKRKAEFATARVCARYALIRLGVKPCALVPQADRSPTWPPGVKGTISHTTGCCAVAVTTATDVLGIGLDVDQAEALDLELEKVVCTRSEQTWLDSLPASDRGNRNYGPRRCTTIAFGITHWPSKSIFFEVRASEACADGPPSRYIARSQPSPPWDFSLTNNSAKSNSSNRPFAITKEMSPFACTHIAARSASSGVRPLIPLRPPGSTTSSDDCSTSSETSNLSRANWEIGIICGEPSFIERKPPVFHSW